MIRCNRCYTVNEDNAMFCEKCGNQLQRQQKEQGVVCYKCGKISYGNTRYCLNCGVYLYGTPQIDDEDDDEDDYDDGGNGGMSAVTIIALILVAIIAFSAYPIYQFIKEDVVKEKTVTEEELIAQFEESDNGEICSKEYDDFDHDGTMEMFVTTVRENDSENYDLWFVAEGQEVQKITKEAGKIQKLVESGNHIFIVWKWAATASVSCYTVEGYASIGPIEPMFPASVEQGNDEDSVIIEGKTMHYNSSSRRFEEK